MNLTNEDAEEILTRMAATLARAGLAEWHVAILDAVDEFPKDTLDAPLTEATEADLRVAGYLTLLHRMLSPMQGQDIRIGFRNRIDTRDLDELNLWFSSTRDTAREFVRDVPASFAPDYQAMTRKLESLMQALDYPTPGPGSVPGYEYRPR